MTDSATFEYANRTGRPPGAFVTAVARLLPGVALVQRQIRPYAEAWRDANVIALAGSGPRWIVLGDSMSQGIGASRFDAGWVNQVQDRLDAVGQHYGIVNLAASGARVQDVLDGQLPVLRALVDRTDDDHRPDLVTVLIGSNDLLRRQHRAELPNRFAELLDKLPAGTVVATLPNPRRAATAVNQLIARAQSRGAVVAADLRSGTATSWRGKLAADHFHPNDAGYADLAEVFAAAITQARVAAAG